MKVIAALGRDQQAAGSMALGAACVELAQLGRRLHLEWNSSKSFLWVIIKTCYHIINTKQWQWYPFH